MAKHHLRVRDRLPEFADEHEAATFWDDHSPIDYPEDFEEVEASFNRPLLRRALLIDVDPRESQALARLAIERGTSPAELAHQWIRERIQENDGQSSGTGGA